LRRRGERAAAGAFFLWLFATVNLLQATGYLMYSGLSDIGDWATVVRDLTPLWFWRGVLSLVGISTYWLATRWAMGELGRRLRTSSGARVVEASRYTLTAYAVGVVLSLAAGLSEPGGAVVVLISGVAGSLGAASGLVWGPQLLRDSRLGEPLEAPLRVTRDWRWIIAAGLIGPVFVLALGHGVRLGPTYHRARASLSDTSAIVRESSRSQGKPSGRCPRINPRRAIPDAALITTSTRKIGVRPSSADDDRTR
jgi:hypothetical protein